MCSPKQRPEKEEEGRTWEIHVAVKNDARFAGSAPQVGLEAESDPGNVGLGLQR